ncbi:hypothetical protein [Mesorhizobium sp. L-8-10]|uniref:hypothetical protein n=1 Tax=Mesorhizobium sp. L-8-10 TaxID=2744523 RepID=UPI001929585A|nr:hypothetical protein [Mesorhizobium sp. L-8-10]
MIVEEAACHSTRQLIRAEVSKSTAMSISADFEMVPGVTAPSTIAPALQKAPRHPATAH